MDSKGRFLRAPELEALVLEKQLVAEHFLRFPAAIAQLRPELMQVGDAVGGAVILGYFLFDTIEVMALVIAPGCQLGNPEEGVYFLQHGFGILYQVGALHQQQLARRLAPGPLGPGEGVSFQAILSEIPESAVRFRLEAAPARPAEPATTPLERVPAPGSEAAPAAS